MSQCFDSTALWLGFLLMLSASAQGEAPRRDHYGDPLPPGAIARLGTSRLRHFGRVFDVAFSPDGKILASVGEDRRIRLWETATGRQLRALPGHPEWVVHIAFSPTGKLLASAGNDYTVRLWNVATGQQIGEPIRAYSKFLAFSPDDKQLAYSSIDTPSRAKGNSETSVCLWDIAAHKVIRTWTVKEPIYSGALSPDGRTLAIAANEWVRKGGGQKGQPVLAENTAILSLWETATGKELWRSSTHLSVIFALAFSPDGKTLASAGGDHDGANSTKHGEVKIWDAATGQKLQDLPGRTDRLDGVRFSADGTYLAAIGQATILWDLKDAQGPRRIWESPDRGTGLAFAPDSCRLAWGTRQAIRMIEFPPREERDHLGGHTGSRSMGSASIPFVAFAPDGKTVISAGDRVRIWDAETGAELRVSPTLLKDCSGAALAPDGKTLITGSQGSTTLWDVATLKSLRTFATPRDYVLAMTLSPDGKTLATTMQHTIAAGEETERLKVGWTTREMMVRLWDVETGKEKGQIGKGTHAPQLAFSPDGNRLACVTMYEKGIMRVWDMKSGNVSLDVKSKTSWGPGQALLCFSPDGKLLASVEEDHTIGLWDAHSGEPVRVLRGHQEHVRTLVFSPDGKTLLSGGDEDLLRLWDVAAGKTVHELSGHQAAVVAAAFSRDGKRIASTSEDTTILIWDVPTLAKLVPPPPPPLTEEELQCLWIDLGSERYAARQRAIRRVLTAPKATVAFLKRRLKPDLPRDDRLARVLDDLDSDSFAVREKASRELARMDKSVGPLLRRVLAEDISPEKRRRVQAVVDTLPRPRRPFRGIAEEERRLLNVVVLLDRIGTAEALDLMRYLARSSELTALLADPSVRRGEAREAEAALARRASHSRKP